MKLGLIFAMVQCHLALTQAVLLTYEGCFKDPNNPLMYAEGISMIPVEQCMDEAIARGHETFGLQYTQSDGRANCWVGEVAGRVPGVPPYDRLPDDDCRPHSFTREVGGITLMYYGAGWMNAVYRITEACSNADGSYLSAEYPCACGTAICSAGDLCFASEEVCQQLSCQAGHEPTPTGCEPCELYYASDGSGPCLQVVARAAGVLQEPTLSVTRDAASEDTVLTLTLDPLTTDTLFGDRRLLYVVDVALSEDALHFQTACRQEWAVAPGSASLTQIYTDFSGACALSASNDGDGKITRHGVLGVFVVSEDAQNPTPAGELMERLWSFDLTLTFDVETISSLQMQLNSNITLEDQLFHLGGFASTLRLFATSDYETELSQPYEFEVGDPMHVQHILDQVSTDLNLIVTSVFLSTKLDPTDQTGLVFDLTAELMLPQSLDSEARFTVIARRCESCFLHVISEVEDKNGRRLKGGRRLAGDPQKLYSLQSLYVDVAPAEEQAAEQDSASLPVALVVVVAVCLVATAGIAGVVGFLCLRAQQVKPTAGKGPEDAQRGPEVIQVELDTEVPEVASGPPAQPDSSGEAPSV